MCTMKVDISREALVLLQSRPIQEMQYVYNEGWHTITIGEGKESSMCNDTMKVGIQPQLEKGRKVVCVRLRLTSPESLQYYYNQDQ